MDVNHSDWDCTLELDGDRPALRLGMRLVEGLSQRGSDRISSARRAGSFGRVQDLARRAVLSRADLKALAAADALASVSDHRHRASWDVAGVEHALPLLKRPEFLEQQPQLLPPSVGQNVLADYAHLGLTLRAHPLALLRDDLGSQHYLSAEEVGGCQPGEVVRVAGLVTIRQRPGKGNAVFISLEDETGVINLIVWRQLAEQQRKILLGAKLLAAWAEIQRAEGVQHLIARRLEDRTELLGGLDIRSRDFH